MHILLLVLVLLALVFLPGFWVRSVMKRYSEPVDRYSVTGGEAARRLLDLHSLEHVGSELIDLGDHYSPNEKMVRLNEDNGLPNCCVPFSGNSISALLRCYRSLSLSLSF